MNTASVRQPRSVFSLLSLVVAGVAATLAGAALMTDDVSGRPSQIVVTPLDDSHPAGRPDNALPVPVADVELPFTPFSPQSAAPDPTDVCLDRPVPLRLRAPC